MTHTCWADPRNDCAACEREETMNEQPETPAVDPDGYYQGTGPADRIRAYLEATVKSQGLDTEVIHSYGRQSVIHELRASDIRAVLAQVEAPSTLCAHCGEGPAIHDCPVPEGAPQGWTLHRYVPEES